MATAKLALEKPSKSTKDWHTPLNSNFQKLEDRLTLTNAGDPNGSVAAEYVGQALYDTTNNKEWFATAADGTVGGTTWTSFDDSLGALAQKDNINNSDWSGTELAVANGGTGAGTAGGARTNLAVPPETRLISSGSYLTGGGDLSADRTLAVDAAVAATASKVIVRDSASRAQVADPSAAQDIATKNYVDNNALDYQTTTVALDNDFASGSTLRCTKIGNTVTLQTEGVVSYDASSSTQQTSAGVVPSAYRPSNIVNRTSHVVRDVQGDHLVQGRVLTDGLFMVQHVDNTLSLDSRTDSGLPVSITYTIT